MTLPLKALVYFNPRPPRGGRRQGIGLHRSEVLFQSTPPARGATAGGRADGDVRRFQSTPPARGATPCLLNVSQNLYEFQSTPPARGATPCLLNVSQNLYEFQSTPPARGATTHHRHCHRTGRISIHAPREGGDHQITETLCRGVQFQSTPPARGATLKKYSHLFNDVDFNPRPPRGGRLPVALCNL